MTKAWAVLPMLVALLCVVAAVYVLTTERRRCRELVMTPHTPEQPRTPNFLPEPLAPHVPHVAPRPRDLPRAEAPRSNVPASKSRFEQLQRDWKQDVLVPPVAQIRSPLVVSHDLQYTRRHRKYTFQSDQRDQAQYPSPANYRLQLLVPLRNVIAITLSSGVFPISEPNVNVYNQWLDIELGGTVYEVQLPEGDYTATSLPTALQTAITAVPALAGFTVTLDPLTQQVTLNNAAPFSLLFATGPHVNSSLWQLLGFLQQDTVTGTSVTGTGIIDLSGALAVDLFVDEISDNIDSIDNAVARIDLQRNLISSTLTFFRPTDNGVPRYFWPISRLQYLTFQFKVKWSELLPNGTRMVRYRPYLFQGRNHTMQLTISSKEYHSPHEDVVELDPQS